MKLRPLTKWREWSLRRRLAAAGGVLLIVAGLAVLLIWLLFFRGDAPPPPSVSDRVSTLSPPTTSESIGTDTSSLPAETPAVAPSPASPTSAATGQDVSPQTPSSSVPTSVSTSSVPPTDSEAAPQASVDGVWTIDTEIGNFEDFSSSYAGYRVGEELANIGTTEAVGRTPMVSGFLEIADSTVTSVEIEVDLPSIVSDRSRRDGLVRQSLRTDQFPTARFLLTEPLEIGSLPAEGEEVRLTAVGDFSVHGVTRPVTVSLGAARSGGLIVVGGSFEIRFEDYDIVPPRVPIVLSVADIARVEWLLNFTR